MHLLLVELDCSDMVRFLWLSNPPVAPQEDKDFAFWGVDFEAYRRRAEELGMFLDRRPVRVVAVLLLLEPAST